MPDSGSFYLSRLGKSRVARIVACFILFSLIFWVVSTKVFRDKSRTRDAGQGQLTSQSWKNPPYSLTVSGTHFLKYGLGNFEPTDEPPTFGPGEGGKPHILRPDQKNSASVSMYRYGMNMECSDEISLNRTIPDFRDPDCKHWQYPRNLPNASVVVVFHNEGFSTLMRTVHSVINRTPPQLLEEVLIIDDYSNEKNLGDKLESYITRWHGKVRLIRNEQREGLINTRSKGARNARGEVVVFLDAHCEVGKNWLPPLLAPIHENRTTMTVPIIDGIQNDNFEVRRVYQEGHLFKGIFEWGLLYKEKELTLYEIGARFHSSAPYESPTHAGGLFAINRDYFLELGAYDPGLLVWGGENFELSFKVWQCGGSILWVPCSRVAHVYKSSMSYSFGSLAKKVKGSVILNNYKRVVETWMDDKYKEYFYTREPVVRFYDMGDISAQLRLKKKLQCKSFQWFMDTVAPDLTTDFPELPPNHHWGQLENIGSGGCVDKFGRQVPTRLTILNCLNGPDDDQLLRLNTKGQLGMGERCVFGDRYGMKLDYCQQGSVSGPWHYNEDTKTIYNDVVKKCVAVDRNISALTLETCNPENNYHQWRFTAVHP